MVCEYRAKVPIHSRRRRRRPKAHLPGTEAQYLWRRRAPRGGHAHAASASQKALGQLTQCRITSPPPHSEYSARPPTVPPGPLRPTPEAPAGTPGAESGRAEGSQGPKSTRAGGRAQKLNRRARGQIACARLRSFESCKRLRKRCLERKISACTRQLPFPLVRFGTQARQHKWLERAVSAYLGRCS